MNEDRPVGIRVGPVTGHFTRGALRMASDPTIRRRWVRQRTILGASRGAAEGGAVGGALGGLAAGRGGAAFGIALGSAVGGIHRGRRYRKGAKFTTGVMAAVDRDMKRRGL